MHVLQPKFSCLPAHGFVQFQKHPPPITRRTVIRVDKQESFRRYAEKRGHLRLTIFSDALNRKYRVA